MGRAMVVTIRGEPSQASPKFACFHTRTLRVPRFSWNNVSDVTCPNVHDVSPPLGVRRARLAHREPRASSETHMVVTDDRSAPPTHSRRIVLPSGTSNVLTLPADTFDLEGNIVEPAPAGGWRLTSRP